METTKVGFSTFDDSAKCLIEEKPALGLFKSMKMYTSEDSLYVSPEFSPVLFTANIAKH